MKLAAVARRMGSNNHCPQLPKRIPKLRAKPRLLKRMSIFLQKTSTWRLSLHQGESQNILVRVKILLKISFIKGKLLPGCSRSFSISYWVKLFCSRGRASMRQEIKKYLNANCFQRL